MSKTYSQCSEKLSELLKGRPNKVGALSAEFFREITGRTRIEDSFIVSLNEYSTLNHELAVYRVSPGRFVVFKTNGRYFKEDPESYEDE